MAKPIENQQELAPLDRRARRKAANRSRIMSSARELFTEEGLSNCGPKDIAELADVGYGTFYSFFDDKYACLGGVIDELLQELLEQVKGGLDGLDGGPEALQAAFDTVLTWSSENPMLLRLILSEPILRLGPEDKAVRSGNSPMEDWCRELLAFAGPEQALAVNIQAFSAQVAALFTALSMSLDQHGSDENAEYQVRLQVQPLFDAMLSTLNKA